MASSSEPKKPTPPLRHDWAAALLSYLVPGLGQIFQGRVGKGLLFLVCIYTLFFYGMSLGNWQNVFLPRVSDVHKFPDVYLPLGIRVPRPIAYRVPFLGQFWVGVAAWPALYQFWNYDEARDVVEEVDPLIGKTIARPKPDPLFKTFMRAPTDEQANVLQNTGTKTWDLGWVYTVIAGVLNLMVIYDALVGPAFIPGNPADDKKKTGAKDAARR
jgi:TM2 domain-containing membrane protein YozV